jgi:predicted DNA-binding transcriptional regulator AlpA
VAFARLATLFTEAAGILHQIAQVPLAVRAQEALMCSVKEPAASARLLTAEDLAARLQVDARTIRRWRRAGRIPAGIEIAGVVRWTPESIDAWVASGGRA